MTKLYEIKVTLSENEKMNLSDDYYKLVYTHSVILVIQAI